PTYEIYRNQFEQYLAGIDAGAPLFYNNEDEEVRAVVNTSGGHLSVRPYNMPLFTYDNGEAVVHTGEGDIKVAVFGRHNLLNMQAAIAVCMELGIDRADCYKAIASF